MCCEYACRELSTCAADGEPGPGQKWDLFERMLAEDPHSAAAQEEAAAMDAAAQRLQASHHFCSCPAQPIRKGHCVAGIPVRVRVVREA